jgi:hypothetical protein
MMADKGSVNMQEIIAQKAGKAKVQAYGGNPLKPIPAKKA